jgi:4-hydroxy-tetrahydrodipicolinate synthase
VKRRVPVIAGTGSNSTDEAIALTKHAKQAGADGALLITPYYNKPTQEGLFRHYKAVAEAVDLPLVLYNIPGRTGVNLLPATVARLVSSPNIVGITVTANLLPGEMSAMAAAALANRWDEARRLHYKLSPLFAALFLETNPIPVKEALGLMGKIDPEVRLPLCPLMPDNRDRLTRVLKDYGLI